MSWRAGLGSLEAYPEKSKGLQVANLGELIRQNDKMWAAFKYLVVPPVTFMERIHGDDHKLGRGTQKRNYRYDIYVIRQGLSRLTYIFMHL